MTAPDGIAAALRHLRDAVSEPALDLVALVSDLAAAAAAAVSSYLGLVVLTTLADVRFAVLQTFEPAQDPVPAASVRLDLPGARDGEVAVTIVLFAAAPGAFVDLAADLAYLLAVDLGDVALDRDLATAAAPDDLAAVSVVNQAIGVLVDRGHDPPSATTALRRLAAGRGMSVVAAAREVLASVPRRRVDPDADVVS